MTYYVRVIPNSDHPNRHYDEWFYTKEEELTYMQHMKQLNYLENKGEKTNDNV